MPLLWNNAKKVNRFTRIVADLHSPKRASTLVVETGFPTSLVDLYVKNQDRLKKQKPKKSKKKSFDDNLEPEKISDRPAVHYLESPPENDSVGFWGPTVSRIENHACPNREDASKRSSLLQGGGRRRRLSDLKKTDMDTGMLLGGIVKVFIVVVLILGMKKVAVSVTLSAFVLLFLEYVGRHWGFCLKPCSKLKSILELCCNWIRERVCKCDNNGDGIDDSLFIAENSEELVPSSVDGEIEVVEPVASDSSSSVDESQDSVSNFDKLSREKRWGFKGMRKGKNAGEEVQDGVGEIVRVKKIKGKFTSKMKKFVAKKLATKREKKCSSIENDSMSKSGESSCDGVDSMIISESDKDCSSSLQSSMELDGRDDILRCSDELMMKESNKGNALDDQKADTESKTKQGYLLIMLVLIVLTGLIGGRIMAFFLSTGMCLILKSVTVLSERINNRSVDIEI